MRPTVVGESGKISTEHRLFTLLDGEHEHGTLSAARGVSTVLVAAILTGAVAAALDTEPTLTPVEHLWLGHVITVCGWLFAIEYVLRLWTAPKRLSARSVGPWEARRRYAASVIGVIDLVALAPGAASMIGRLDVSWIRALELLWLLKLMRYVPALGLVITVVRHSLRSLGAALTVMVTLMVLAAGVIYAIERHAQPEVFGSIVRTLWWAIVTMGTVGYGDMVPITPAGKMFASVIMIIGIAMFAVPAGIMATGFATEIRKRNFVVNWQMVARVPLFRGLDAPRIAEIARLLKPEVVPADYVIVRRGEPAEAMFFIVEGQVEIDLVPTPVRLGRGQYFGEIALLRDAARTATVTAIDECHLLSLDVGDFRRLLGNHPDLKETLQRVADERQPGH